MLGKTESLVSASGHVIIRPAAIEDITSILEMRTANEGRILGSMEEVRRAIEQTPDLVYVAESGRKILGYVLGSVNSMNPKRGWIRGFAVSKDEPGDVLSRSLIGVLLSSFQAEGISAVSIIRHENAALELLKSMGFRETDVGIQERPRLGISSALDSPEGPEINLPALLTRDLPSRASPLDLMTESNTSESLTGVLTAATFFLLAVVLSKSNPGLAAPAMFLVISAIGFLFGALVYGGVSGEVARLRMYPDWKQERAERMLETGNIVSEYFGFYYLMFSLPPIMFYLEGSVIGSLSLVVSILGLALYHFLGYSILERYFSTATVGTSKFNRFGARRFKIKWKFSIAVGVLLVFVVMSFLAITNQLPLMSPSLSQDSAIAASAIFTIGLAAFCSTRHESTSTCVGAL